LFDAVESVRLDLVLRAWKVGTVVLGGGFKPARLKPKGAAPRAALDITLKRNALKRAPAHRTTGSDRTTNGV